MPIDPVCRMHISIGKERASYKGFGYFFCSEACRRQFMQDPAAFVK